jgi:hypothetical protein
MCVNVDLDQVTIGPGLVIKNQSIGDALHFAQFEYVHVTIPYLFPNIWLMIHYLRGVDGIIGVGPVDLTTGTLSPDVNATIPTVTDNALAQQLISQEVLGVSFAPASSNVSIST